MELFRELKLIMNLFEGKFFLVVYNSFDLEKQSPWSLFNPALFFDCNSLSFLIFVIVNSWNYDFLESSVELMEANIRVQQRKDLIFRFSNAFLLIYESSLIFSEELSTNIRLLHHPNRGSLKQMMLFSVIFNEPNLGRTIVIIAFLDHSLTTVSILETNSLLHSR